MALINAACVGEDNKEDPTDGPDTDKTENPTDGRDGANKSDARALAADETGAWMLPPTAAAALTSLSEIKPPGPLAATRDKSTPRDWANFRTAGVALGAEEGVRAKEEGMPVKTDDESVGAV